MEPKMKTAGNRKDRETNILLGIADSTRMTGKSAVDIEHESIMQLWYCNGECVLGEDKEKYKKWKPKVLF